MQKSDHALRTIGGTAPTGRRALALLALTASMAAGCGDRSDQGRSAAAPAAMPAPAASPAPASPPVPAGTPRMAIGRVLVISPPESALTPEAPAPPQPTAEYRSLEAARDAVEAMLRIALGRRDTVVHYVRSTVEFEYNWAKGPARGLAVEVAVNDTICPQEKLLDAMRAAGWVDDWTYSSDGDDGTRMGMVCRQFLCVVEGRWVGFDPTDSTYIPPSGCRITATCVPRRRDDVPSK